MYLVITGLKCTYSLQVKKKQIKFITILFTTQQRVQLVLHGVVTEAAVPQIAESDTRMRQAVEQTDQRAERRLSFEIP